LRHYSCPFKVACAALFHSPTSIVLRIFAIWLLNTAVDCAGVGAGEVANVGSAVGAEAGACEDALDAAGAGAATEDAAADGTEEDDAAAAAAGAGARGWPTG
jgi:hypothetical protein